MLSSIGCVVGAQMRTVTLSFFRHIIALPGRVYFANAVLGVLILAAVTWLVDVVSFACGIDMAGSGSS